MEFFDPGGVPLLQIIPNTSRNKYFYSNGLSKIIPRLTLKVHSRLEDCYFLWDQFSPKKSLFDLWDFRMAWYEGYKNTLSFYTLYEGKSPIALLPLWYSRQKKRHEWFGSNWMEDNTFFVKDPYHIDLLYAIFPSPLHLNALEIDEEVKGLLQGKLKKDDPKNIKDLAALSSIEELLVTFQKKHRYNLRADYELVQALKPKIMETEKKDMKLMETLIHMNIEQFKDKENDESDLVDKERVVTYRNIMKNAGSYKVKFIEVYIQNRLAGIDFLISYNNIYYAVKGGIDMKRFKGVSNFLVYYEFDDAIKRNFSLFDCLQVDYGWKHRFFDQREVFTFEK